MRKSAFLYVKLLRIMHDLLEMVSVLCSPKGPPPAEVKARTDIL